MKTTITSITVIILTIPVITVAETLVVPSEYVTIQTAIDASLDDDTIQVYPGLYTGKIDFKGKAITVMGVPDYTGAPMIENPGDFAVSFSNAETTECKLKNFVIRNSSMAVFIAASSPSLHNLNIVTNENGIGAYAGSEPDIKNCIFWNNTNGDINGCKARYSFIPGTWQSNMDDLFGYWQFDEEGGNVASDRTGKNHGIVYGGARRVEGVAGNAIFLDGIDDYVDCIIDEMLQMIGDVSLSVWVKPEDYGIVIAIEGWAVDFGEPVSNTAFYLKVTHRPGRDIVLYAHEYSNGINEQYDFDPVSWMNWTHVAVVRDISERTVCIYYNGELIDVFNYVNQPYNPGNKLHITIGSHSSGTEAYKGAIDEVALFDKTLSFEEIQTLYSAGLAGESLEGTVVNDPLFADPNHSDYHLKSEQGRHWPAMDIWVSDSVTSPCIDSGDPNMNFSKEPEPNGGRINMGVFGGTPYASLSEGK